MNLGIIMILVALGLLIYLSFRGVSILILAPVLSMFLVLTTGDMPMLHAFTGPLMDTASTYIKILFPIFLTGAIFGKLMDETGAAKAIAHWIAGKLGVKRAITAVVLATAILTYGGVSLFVVVFVVYPLGMALFKEADIPKRLLPAAVALGAFTFTMTALPGSPQALNAMPTTALGTDIYAAPVLGIIAGAIMLILGNLWINKRAEVLKAKGETYGNHNDDHHTKDEKLPPVGLAFLPIVIIFAINFVLVNIYYKSESVIAHYNELGVGINGFWAVIVALVVATIVIAVTLRDYIEDINKTLTEGATSSVVPLFAIAAVVGFGGVVKATAGFEVFKNAILGMQLPGIFKVGFATSAIAGIVGSSSGGTGIALAALAPDFLKMGINPQAIHRVMLVAAGGLDSLPHSGAIVVLLGIMGISHKDGYGDIGMVTVVLPIIATVTIMLTYVTTGIV